MSVHFRSNIWMAGSKFSIDDMKEWIHPVLYQWFMLVVV